MAPINGIICACVRPNLPLRENSNESHDGREACQEIFMSKCMEGA